MRFPAPVFLFLAVALSATTSSAVTRNVPGDHGTIQAAINASANGDEIVVAPGTYNENLQIFNKCVVLRSSGGAGMTTINGGGTGHTVFFSNNTAAACNPDAEIRGFTITGGAGGAGQGGGITLANQADVRIVENSILNNTSTDGAGIISIESNPTILSNSIVGNVAQRLGGGIGLFDSPNAVIQSNTITDNKAEGIPLEFPSGGAIFITAGMGNNTTQAPTIQFNQIHRNRAEFAGGAISYRRGAAGILDTNNITQNSAAFGGAIHEETNLNVGPTISNNTISGNKAVITPSVEPTGDAGGKGGGISLFADSLTTIRNNQITNNTADELGGGIVAAERANATITANVIRGNRTTQDNQFWSGGGIYVADATADVRNNVICENTSRLGGGMATLGGASVTLVNNSFVFNTATLPDNVAPAGGGGLFVNQNTTNLGATNNLFAHNSNYQVVDEENPSNWAFRNTLINNDGEGAFFHTATGTASNSAAALDGNANLNWANTVDGPPNLASSTSCIDFINGGGLTSTSPAIDKGDNLPCPQTDIRGVARPQNGTCDIGAHEFVSTTIADTVGLHDGDTSAFFLRNSHANGIADQTYFFGPAGAGWIPIAGDWNGDGVETPGLYDPQNGAFFLRDAHANGNADRTFFLGPGGQGWLPIAGDWNGNGIDKVGLYDPATGAFFLRNSHANGNADQVFFFGPGGQGWLPIAGDWNGNGTHNVGVYDPANGAFFLRNSHTNGPADETFFFGPGNSGWAPIAGDWDKANGETVGLYDPVNGAFFLNNAHANGPAANTFFFGPANAGWRPISGNWNGS